MIIKKETITSKSNPSVGFLSSLSEKKYRERYGMFRTDGIKLARELLERGITPETLYIKESSADKIIAELAGFSSEAVILSDALFDRVSEEKSPEGVICIIKHLDNLKKIATIYNSADFPQGWKEDRIMLLESLRDPGNLGTVIRSATALSMERLIISADSADLYNSKTVRASMGTLFGMKIDIVDSLPHAAEILKGLGRRVFSAALDREAVGLNKLALSASDCFAVGNEGHGLSAEMLMASTGKVFIPITEGAESLNAAAAAAILLWEHRRQTV